MRSTGENYENLCSRVKIDNVNFRKSVVLCANSGGDKKEHDMLKQVTRLVLLNTNNMVSCLLGRLLWTYDSQSFLPRGRVMHRARHLSFVIPWPPRHYSPRGWLYGDIVTDVSVDFFVCLESKASRPSMPNRSLHANNKANTSRVNEIKQTSERNQWKYEKLNVGISVS